MEAFRLMLQPQVYIVYIVEQESTICYTDIRRANIEFCLRLWLSGFGRLSRISGTGSNFQESDYPKQHNLRGSGHIDNSRMLPYSRLAVYVGIVL